MSSKRTVEDPIEDAPEVKESKPVFDIPGVVDTKHEDEGDWFEHPTADTVELAPNQIDNFAAVLLDENGNGLRRVKVRSMFTSDFERGERAMLTRAARMSQKKRAAFEKDARFRLMAKHCVSDWEFTQRDGSPIPCTPENVETFMVAPEYRNYRGFIMAAVMKLQGDYQEASEEDRGN